MATTKLEDLTLIVNQETIAQHIVQLSDELIADFATEFKSGQAALIGIETRGVTLAARLKALLERKMQLPKIDLGSLGITLYRDDIAARQNPTIIKPTELMFPLDDRVIILVDDVLFTGRTIRAALNEIMDFGRPKLIRLLVLVDRDERQLPIQADYVAIRKKYENSGKILVRLQESDNLTEGIYRSK